MGTLGGWDSPTTDLATGGPQYYYIRLADLSSFFDNPKLIPSVVMSGLQIELELESPVIAFKSTKASGSVSYAINECQLFTDTFQLCDSTARRMNQLAASSGLELSYEASAATFTSASTGQNRFSINANLSVSRALQVFAVSIPNINLVSTADSLNNDQGTTLDSWQFRVVSSYYPTAQVQGLRDSLVATLHSFDKLRNCNASSSTAVDYTSFEGYPSPTVSQRNCAAVGTDLQRSTILNTSGIPVNQSRALVLDFTFTDAISRSIYMFVSYQKACTVFLQNQVVKE
jgi:hypothetical protein